MNERGVTFISSRCGESQLTAEALRAHVELLHGGVEHAVSKASHRPTRRIPEEPSARGREQAGQVFLSPNDQLSPAQTKDVGSQRHLAIRRVRLWVAPEDSRLGSLPALALSASLGFALIVVAYAAARNGHAWGQYCYWAGEAIMFLPLAARVALSRRLSEGEAVGLVLVAALLQYLVQFAYSPLRFAFPDAIAHWQTTVDVIRTHHLFHVNYVLPISPYYPGLELITSAFSSMSGLSVFQAGIIVAGVAHLLLIVTLYALGKAATGSIKLAALACIIYQTNPHYQFFDSYFIYLGAAMPLLLLAVLVVSFDNGMTVLSQYGADHHSHKWSLFVVYTCAVATVVASHHVSALVLAGVVCMLAVFRLGVPRLPLAITLHPTAVRARMLGASIAAIALVGVWMTFVAPETFQYLSPTVSALTRGLSGLFSHAKGVHSALSGGGPFAGQLLSYAMTGLIAIAIPFGVWRIARERRSALAVFLGLLAFSYYVLILVRLAVPDGAELAGRAFTYVYVPVSLALAVVVTRARGSRPLTWASLAIPVAFVAILFLGGLVSGWPPYWERLPGGYQISGLERSVSAPDLAVARWFGQNLPPGGRAAVDLVDYALVGTIGRQSVVRNGGPLFYAPRFLTIGRALVQTQSIRYVVVDQRLARGAPASGRYFPDDPPSSSSRRPLSLASLEKFNRIDGISRVYDNGDILVFDLTGSPYSP